MVLGGLWPAGEQRSNLTTLSACSPESSALHRSPVPWASPLACYRRTRRLATTLPLAMLKGCCGCCKGQEAHLLACVQVQVQHMAQRKVLWHQPQGVAAAVEAPGLRAGKDGSCVGLAGHHPILPHRHHLV